MDHAQRIAAVERETDALIDTFEAGALDVAVPTCPGWTVRDLLVHLQQFSGWWSHVLCDALSLPHASFAPEPDDDEQLVGWYEQAAQELISKLRDASAELEAWTWVPDDQSAGFIARRCANELAVHRFDAQMARGSAEPIDTALAADGIDEIFVMIRSRPPGRGGNGETLHLHGTDPPDDIDGDRSHEWMITIGPDAVHVTHEHGKGDLALRGSVSDLELLLYGRPSLGSVERFGDDGVLDAWRSTFTF